MEKTYRVLLVDDHPLITAAYQKAFQLIQEKYPPVGFKVIEAHNLARAHHELARYNTHQPPDIVFVDLKLPPSPDVDFLSGEDFALAVKEKFPKTKIVIATMFNNNFRIHSIFQSVNPDGFLVKNDLTENELQFCISDMLEGVPYYSKTVRRALRKYVSNDMRLDFIDRKILYQLSLGSKTKDLSSLLPLSRNGIERRKKQLKEIFGVAHKGDRALLQKARNLGYI